MEAEEGSDRAAAAAVVEGGNGMRDEADTQQGCMAQLAQKHGDTPFFW